VLPHVATIAKAFNAQVNLLQILERPPTSDLSPYMDPLDWQIKKIEAESYLNTVKARLEKSRVPVQTTLLECRAAEQIIEFAQNGPTDLVVLSSHGRHGLSSWKISSVGQQILQRMPISILLIRASQPEDAHADPVRYQRLFVPLDGSRRAEAALPIALTLAQAHDAELLLTQIVNAPELARRMPLTSEDAELVKRLIERNQEEGTNYLAQIRTELPGKTQTRLRVSQNVMGALQDVVRQEQVDLVILSAHGYSGEVKWPYGGVTSRFITDGTTPLLIFQDMPRDGVEPTSGAIAGNSHSYKSVSN
jgi:nucleotide-binding universal stress UspA family protein